MRKSLSILATSILVTLAAPALAITIDGGPAWPGSADVSGIIGSGGIGTGGDTWIYPNIGNSLVEHLYFGLTTSGTNGFSGDGAGVSGAELFTWHADTANSIEYRGQISVPTTSGNLLYLTRLMLTAWSGSSVISDATTQALAGGVNSLIEITGASFTVKREIEIYDGSTWQNALSFYNSIPNKNTMGTGINLNTGFYWDDLPPVTPSVPEPATLGLIGLGLLGLGLSRRRG